MSNKLDTDGSMVSKPLWKQHVVPRMGGILVSATVSALNNAGALCCHFKSQQSSKL
jgi:hypothetical protein